MSEKENKSGFKKSREKGLIQKEIDKHYRVTKSDEVFYRV